MGNFLIRERPLFLFLNIRDRLNYGKSIKMGNYAYHLLHLWRKLGLVEVEKIGRTNEITLTKKGEEVYYYASKIREIIQWQK